MTTRPAGLSALLAATFLLAFPVAAQPAPPAPPAKAPAIDPADFDKAAKPCEDFYQFANGAWLASHPIPADRRRYGSFDALSDRNRDVVKKILDETSVKAEWPKAHRSRRSPTSTRPGWTARRARRRAPR